MSNIWVLLKVQFLQLFSLNKMLHTKEKKERRKFIAIFIGIILLIVYLFFVSFVYSYSLATVFEKEGKMELLLGLMMAATSLMSFLVTLYKVNGTLFGFKDYDLVMSLPISTRMIVASRIMMLYSMNVLFSFLLMVPAVVVYAMKVTPEPSFYLLFSVSLFFIPLLPIIVATIIGSFIMIVSMRFKHGKAINILLNFVVLVLFMASMMNIGGGIKELTKALNALADQVSSLYPLTNMYINAVCHTDYLSFILFISISVIAFLLYVYSIGTRFKQIQSVLMTKGKKERYFMKEQVQSSPFKALYVKELKRYFSSTIYVLNTALGLVLYTVATIALLFVDLDQIWANLALPQITSTIETAIPLIVSVFVALSCTTMCSISLEGKNVWILQSAPISIELICWSKIAVNLTLSVPVIVLNNLLLLYVLKPSFVDGILLFLVPLVYALFIAFSGMVINLRFPNFDWTNEVAVIKQSVASFISVFGGLLSCLIPIGLLLLIPNINPYVLLVCLTILLLILCLLMYGYMKSRGAKVLKADL